MPEGVDSEVLVPQLHVHLATWQQLVSDAGPAMHTVR